MAKNCKLLIIKDLQALNSQSFTIFTILFILHQKCTQLFFLQVYNIQDIKENLPKIEHILNSILPSDNLPCCFEDGGKTEMNYKQP